MAFLKSYILVNDQVGRPHLSGGKVDAWQQQSQKGGQAALVAITRGALLQESTTQAVDDDTHHHNLRGTKPYESLDHAGIVVDCTYRDFSEIGDKMLKLLLPIEDFETRLQVFRDSHRVQELFQIDNGTPVIVDFHDIIYPGIVRYVGPIRGINKANGIYFGVELVDHPGHGDCDGFIKGKQYFTTEDSDGGCFVDASRIRIQHVPQASSNITSNHDLYSDSSTTNNNRSLVYNNNNASRAFAQPSTSSSSTSPFSSSSSSNSVAAGSTKPHSNNHGLKSLLPSIHLRSKQQPQEPIISAYGYNNNNNSSSGYSSAKSEASGAGGGGRKLVSSIAHAFGGGRNDANKHSSNTTTTAIINPAAATSYRNPNDADYYRQNRGYDGRLSATPTPPPPPVLANFNDDHFHALYQNNDRALSPPLIQQQVTTTTTVRRSDKESPRVLGRRQQQQQQHVERNIPIAIQQADDDEQQQQQPRNSRQHPSSASAAALAIAARITDVTPIHLHDRVVWIDEEGKNNYYGTVKWIGHMPEIDHDWMVGVEFDEPIGSGTGVYEEEQLFKARQNHASFVPVAGLMLANDFLPPSASDAENNDNTRKYYSSKVSMTPHASRNLYPNINVNTISIRNNDNTNSNLFIEPLPAIEQLKISTTKQQQSQQSSNNNPFCRSGDHAGERISPEQQQSPPSPQRPIGFVPPQRHDSMTEVAEIFFTNEDDHYYEQQNSTNNVFNNNENVQPTTQQPSALARKLASCDEPSGRWKGIQGTQNSCYLDTTLFSMFYFTSVFDTLLHRPQRATDIADYAVVQRTLRDSIVRPLRESRFVRHGNVMQLRKLLDSLGQVSGLMGDEKDVEEFIESMLTQTLKADPLLHLSSGETSTMLQIIVEDAKKIQQSVPTVQNLFDESMRAQNIQLTRVPSCLILQLPRSGSHYKMFRFTIPNLWLDITESLKQQHMSSTNNRIRLQLFAVICIRTSHYVAFVRSRNKLSKPSRGDNTIATGGGGGEWYFFDSMADREEYPVMPPMENDSGTTAAADDTTNGSSVAPSGCCVPEVRRVWPHNLDYWIGTDEGIRKMRQFLVDNGLVGGGSSSSSRGSPTAANGAGNDADATCHVSYSVHDDTFNNNALPADIPNAQLSRFLQDAYVCMYEQRVESSDADSNATDSLYSFK